MQWNFHMTPYIPNLLFPTTDTVELHLYEILVNAPLTEFSLLQFLYLNASFYHVNEK